MMSFDPYDVAAPTNVDEIRAHANAYAYEWGYLDASRAAQVEMPSVPDGWPSAWLEYDRRALHRMSIQSAFKEWIATGTLPGL
jgi:hypothetical protein